MAEMVDETMDALDEDEDELDEEANEEVEKVLFDITNGKLGEMPTKVGALPVRLLVAASWMYKKDSVTLTATFSYTDKCATTRRRRGVRGYAAAA